MAKDRRAEKIWKVSPKTTRAAFKEQVDNYFAECELLETRPTIAGLCLHVGFKSVNHLQEFGKMNNNRCAEIVDYAILQIEKRYEEDLMSGKNVVGAIFALKRLGWEDNILNKLADLKEEKKEEPKATTIQVEIVKGK